MSVQLKPCPFCGWRGNLARIISPEGEARGERPSWDIDCTGCGFWRRFDSEAEAVTKWNERVPNAEVEALRKLLEQGVVRIRQAIHYQTWPGAQNWVSDVEEHLAGSHSVGSAYPKTEDTK